MKRGGHLSDSKCIPGVNVQWPWSELLLSGKKTVETRSYPIPAKFIGCELAVIETPGPRGKREAGIKQARIVGTIVFSESILYRTKRDWSNDRNRHCVREDDPQFAFRTTKPKWGWVVTTVVRFKRPVPPPKMRGIVFAKQCKIPKGNV